MTSKKINIFDHIKQWGKWYTAYLANIANRQVNTFSSTLSRLKNGEEGTFATRKRIVDAINKAENADYIVHDFDWSNREGKWNGKKQ